MSKKKPQKTEQSKPEPPAPAENHSLIQDKTANMNLRTRMQEFLARPKARNSTVDALDGVELVIEALLEL